MEPASIPLSPKPGEKLKRTLAECVPVTPEKPQPTLTLLVSIKSASRLEWEISAQGLGPNQGFHLKNQGYYQPIIPLHKPFPFKTTTTTTMTPICHYYTDMVLK